MIRQGVLTAIGNTPLVRLPFQTPAHVCAKLEFSNPGGSVKDRPALFLIEHAEREGILKRGGTIVEASSGNFGIALAMIGAAKGYRVIITTATTTSADKIRALESFGADVVRCPPTIFADDPENYRSVATAIHSKTAGSFMPDQFHNLLNPLSHYSWLGPEIWSQTQGKVTHLFAAAGSGGTVSGVGKFLKERNTNIRIYAVDAAGSFYSTGGKPVPYHLDGMGLDAEWPTLDTSVIDDVIPVYDEEGFSMMRELAHTHGTLVGPSSGAVAAAVTRSLGKFKKGDTIVMIFGDSGRSYFSKGYFCSQLS